MAGCQGPPPAGGGLPTSARRRSGVGCGRRRATGVLSRQRSLERPRCGKSNSSATAAACHSPPRGGTSPSLGSRRSISRRLNPLRVELAGLLRGLSLVADDRDGRRLAEALPLVVSCRLSSLLMTTGAHSMLRRDGIFPSAHLRSCAACNPRCAMRRSRGWPLAPLRWAPECAGPYRPIAVRAYIRMAQRPAGCFALSYAAWPRACALKSARVHIEHNSRSSAS